MPYSSIYPSNRRTVFVGILTVSDRCSEGKTQDLSGPNLQKVLQNCDGIKAVVKVRKIVPDEIDQIKETLLAWSDHDGIDFIVSTGGTGFGPRDVTPEATAEVIEKEATGIVISVVVASLAITPHAMLTRLKCGIRGKTLILNLPGSRKASEECLCVVLPVLGHAISLIKNDLETVSNEHGEPKDRRSSSGYDSEQSSGVSLNTSPYQNPSSFLFHQQQNNPLQSFPDSFGHHHHKEEYSHTHLPQMLTVPSPHFSIASVSSTVTEAELCMVEVDRDTSPQSLK